MTAVAVASPCDDQIDLQTGRRILVENTANLSQLLSPKCCSSSLLASPKSPLTADRKMVLHPELFKIVRGKEDFSAKLVAVQGFKVRSLHGLGASCTKNDTDPHSIAGCFQGPQKRIRRMVGLTLC
jgi:hypothetical protein